MPRLEAKAEKSLLLDLEQRSPTDPWRTGETRAALDLPIALGDLAYDALKGLTGTREN
jgi:hypothetical protein